ncbi:MAG: trehalose-phosphatase [Nitriliruptoraceae bacterium]
MTVPADRRRIDDVRAIAASVHDVTRHLVVLDFDGTLSPIVDIPDDAALAEGAMAALTALCQRTEVAILSGRPVDDVLPRLGDLPVTIIGNHGTEVLDAAGRRTSLFDRTVASDTLRAVERELRDLVHEDAGWGIEPKPASIAVHHRRVDPDVVRRVLPKVQALLNRHASAPPGWRVLEGKAVTELRPAAVDKGTALSWIADRHPDLRLLVLGDDVTDEDAFAVAEQRRGIAVLVASQPRRTHASARIASPARVVELLRRLATDQPDDDGVASDPWRRRYHPIGEYGMLSDLRTAALVSPDASIDWLCLPRFDSPSVFAALLDADRGGRWRIRPTRRTEIRRSWLGESNVLVTSFVEAGVTLMTVTDLMVHSRVSASTVGYAGHHLLRRVETFAPVEIEIDFQPRFDYGRATTTLAHVDDGLVATAGIDQVTLTAPGFRFDVAPCRDEHGDIATSVTRLEAGQTRWLTLRSGHPARDPHSHLAPQELLDLTLRTWLRWAGNIEYDGPWRDTVVRSALALKGLVYEPTGALVAAVTTSLPEEVGGERNWDYRYAWIRDSAYVLETMLRVGQRAEAETFIRWLGQLSENIGGTHALRPLYRITGEDDLTEFELDHLEGYRGSKPVRIGNGAASQLQLDIFGAAMQLGYLTERAGTEIPAVDWPTVKELVSTVAARWQEPDAGLWEIRSAPKHHTFSKFQCWLAVDRAIRIGRDLGLKAPYAEWTKIATEIRASILEHGFDAERGTFTQAYGESETDASLLLLPLKGFLPPTDPRVRSTVKAIREDLEISDGLLLRYTTEDGLRGHEGAFQLCSWWLVELLARMGDLEEAERLFERLSRFAGPLGLFAEELDADTFQQLGNFPQAFTHMGLIGAATAIADERRARGQ